MRLALGIVVGAGCVVVLVALARGLVAALEARPSSLRARYAAEVRAGLAGIAAAWSSSSPPLVTDDDLVGLPPPVRTYLMRAGVVGKPRVVDLHAVFHARFRTARDAPWMKRASISTSSSAPIPAACS